MAYERVHWRTALNKVIESFSLPCSAEQLLAS
jgi:hypothetical protein